MGRPRKGRENGSYEPLSPYEKNLKSKKTLKNRRAAGRLRSQKLRRSRGVKARVSLTGAKRKMARKNATQKATLRKQAQRSRDREKKVDQNKN